MFELTKTMAECQRSLLGSTKLFLDTIYKSVSQKEALFFKNPLPG